MKKKKKTCIKTNKDAFLLLWSGPQRWKVTKQMAKCVCVRARVCAQPIFNSCLLEAALRAAGDNYTARLMAKVVSLRDGSANGSPRVSFRPFFSAIFQPDRATHSFFLIVI